MILNGQTIQNKGYYLKFSEFAKNGFMSKKLDVFEIVVGLRGCTSFANLLLVLGFMWVDSFQNT